MDKGTCDGVRAERHYLVRERKLAMRFTINTLKMVHSDDEPHLKDALNGKEADPWR